MNTSAQAPASENPHARFAVAMDHADQQLRATLIALSELLGHAAALPPLSSGTISLHTQRIIGGTITSLLDVHAQFRQAAGNGEYLEGVAVLAELAAKSREEALATTRNFVADARVDAPPTTGLPAHVAKQFARAEGFGAKASDLNDPLAMMDAEKKRACGALPPNPVPSADPA